MDIWTPSEPLRGRRRAAWALDGAVALVALLMMFPFVIGTRDAPQVLAVLVAFALATPLLVRRMWPRPVFVWMFLVAAVAGWWLEQMVWSAGFLVALYTVASRCSRRWTIGCALALAGGVVVWSYRRYPDASGWVGVAVLLVTIIAAVTAFGLYIHTRRVLLSELEERARRLEFERDQQGELAAAAERARIARELHDVVAHHLTVMVALADGAAAQTERAPERAGDAMRTVSATGRQALTDTRRLLGVLREAADGEPVRSPLPGLADLDELLSGVRAAGLPVRYEVDGARPELDAGAQLTLFRIVQEALTNTMKHAGPQAAASVRISYLRDGVCLEIVDDGRGSPSPAGSGRGLPGMRERMAAVGGEVTSGPEPGRGWAVRARLPHTGTVTS